VTKTRVALTDALKQEFQKDLELFKQFLLLLNDSSPIRNVELMWKEENEVLDPKKLKFKSRVGTADALVQLEPAGSLNAKRSAPSTLFCDLVNGFGAHEEGTCAKSDMPAKKRCESTGCSQIYSCHVGLTDIAVPVQCDDEYLGTLFSGQVLTSPPTKEGFRFVRESLANQTHIKMASLEAAYYLVPVVEQGQVAQMVRTLELFARYIANSWKRMKIMSEYQRSRDRELALDRKELASILLSGEIGNRNELKAFAERIGLENVPDHVVVLQLAHSGSDADSRERFGQQTTLNRETHLIEDMCQAWPNLLATVVRPGELCVFTGYEARNAGHERISLQELANSLAAAAGEHSAGLARIGVSAAHRQPEELVHAYQEACVALHSGSGQICFFNDPVSSNRKPIETLERMVKEIQKGSDSSAAIQEFLAQAMRTNHSPQGVQQSRAYLTWAIEHLALEVVCVGVDPHSFRSAKEQALSGVLNAPSPFSSSEAFRRFAKILEQTVASAFTQREEKIVHTISRLVEERGIAHVKIKELGESLRLSTGHLSRVFRRTTGITLEEFLIRHRVELSKRALLDPRLNVAEVADRCGFCNPAYFASVFKKYVKCTPRQFARQPHASESLAGQPHLARNNAHAPSVSRKALAGPRTGRGAGVV
jgi:AraC-like DNA-binding protein/ligand-binding sensor protein